MKRLFPPVAWPIALSLSLLTACGDAPAPSAAMPEPIVQGRQLRFPANHPQLALLGVTAARAASSVTLDLPAKLVWNEERTQRIVPAFAGRVVAIRADVGQSVKSGAVLAQLASPDFAVAQADTAKAEADARLTRRALQRQRELFDAGIVARKDLEQAEAEDARAQAEVTRAAARTRLYGGGDSVNQQLALRAGLAGVVVERHLSPGQELRPDQNDAPPLFVVSDPSSLWVQIDAREQDADALRPGTRFTLQVPTLPGQSFEGRVTATADAIDPGSRTLRVRGLVPNPERRLKAEMLGTVRLAREIGAGVLVPASAVTLRGNLHWVMVQLQPGVFEAREVTIAHEGAREVLVSEGLKDGDQVVTQNTLLLARQFRIAQDEAAVAPAAAASQPAGAR